MTNQEAKMQIQSIPEKIWNQLSEPDREAMEVAFSALEAQETCDDTISRQLAIDALNEYSNNETTSTEKAVGVDYCVDIIQNLPSAQIEIIHCRDCKWWEKQEKTLQGKCYLLQQIYPTGAWYCGNAERKANESKH